MARPGDLIVVHMLEPQAMGSYFSRSRWPLHITLLPWFSANEAQLLQLRRQLQQLALTLPPVTAVVGAEAQFGPQQNIPVNVIAGNMLQPLHQALLNLAQLLQLPLASTDYTDKNFTAHISRYEDRYASEGDQLALHDFYLVALQRDNSCQIVGRFELKGEPSNG
jgi:2'-5' RNA ligase